MYCKDLDFAYWGTADVTEICKSDLKVSIQVLNLTLSKRTLQQFSYDVAAQILHEIMGSVATPNAASHVDRVGVEDEIPHSPFQTLCFFHKFGNLFEIAWVCEGWQALSKLFQDTRFTNLPLNFQ